jgi:hypothetical protein
MSAQNSKVKDLHSQNDEKDKVFADNLPFLWKYTDFDLNANRIILVVLRLLQAVFLTSQMVNPDEYWQSTQVAYKWVYDDKGDVFLPWEWSEMW